jgi:hypothetical protein
VTLSACCSRGGRVNIQQVTQLAGHDVVELVTAQVVGAEDRLERASTSGSSIG